VNGEGEHIIATNQTQFPTNFHHIEPKRKYNDIRPITSPHHNRALVTTNNYVNHHTKPFIIINQSKDAFCLGVGKGKRIRLMAN